MRIVQTVFGVFHHFELAREMAARGHLKKLYSTWPWARVKREGLSRSLVETYPWIHTLEYAAGRSPVSLGRLPDHLGYANALLFDRFTLSRLQHLAQPPDALIAISGSSLRTGAWLQSVGGTFICDRGSTHQRFQEQLLAEEFARWGQNFAVSDPRDTMREEAIYDQADMISVPSTFAADSFATMGVPTEKVRVVPYGVRLERFQPAPAPPASETFEVLFVGSVGLRKGLPYLLEAFAQLRHPRKRLRIVGPLQPEFRQLLPQMPRGSVDILGPMPQSAISEMMRSSHVLVLPSVEEGLAMVMAQAMASGCPVLASTNTGAADLFTDGREGFIVPARSTAMLAARLEELAQDHVGRNEMRDAAIRRVRALDGWHDYGIRWERLLHELRTA